MREFEVIDHPQRSDEWKRARLGTFTASVAHEMLATIKGGEAAARRDLRIRLVCERLTQQPEEDGYMNADMARGIELEPDAFAAFEALTGTLATQVGFCRHVTHLAGCSPDGVINDFEGVLELKAPRAANHWAWLRGDPVVPPRYLPQILHTLWITGSHYADFLSFNPMFPAHLRTFYVRYYRNDAEVSAYASKALAFLEEVEREYQAALGWHAVEAPYAVVAGR